MPTADPKAQRRQEILEAAKLAFAELGYHKASVSEVIGRAGIARGTFYLYFSSKQGVFDSILDEALRELRERISRVEVGPGFPSPRAQLRDCFLRVFRFVLGDPPLTRILLNQALTSDGEAAARVGAFFADVRGLIQGALALGLEMGLVRPCSPEIVGAALLGAVRGIVEHMMSLDPPPQVETVTDEVMAFCLQAVLIEGVG